MEIYLWKTITLISICLILVDIGRCGNNGRDNKTDKSYTDSYSNKYYGDIVGRCRPSCRRVGYWDQILSIKGKKYDNGVIFRGTINEQFGGILPACGINGLTRLDDYDKSYRNYSEVSKYSREIKSGRVFFCKYPDCPCGKMNMLDFDDIKITRNSMPFKPLEKHNGFTFINGYVSRASSLCNKKRSLYGSISVNVSRPNILCGKKLSTDEPGIVMMRSDGTRFSILSGFFGDLFFENAKVSISGYRDGKKETVVAITICHNPVFIEFGYAFRSIDYLEIKTENIRLESSYSYPAVDSILTCTTNTPVNPKYGFFREAEGDKEDGEEEENNEQISERLSTDTLIIHDDDVISDRSDLKEGYGDYDDEDSKHLRNSGASDQIDRSSESFDHGVAGSHNQKHARREKSIVSEHGIEKFESNQSEQSLDDDSANAKHRRRSKDKSRTLDYSDYSHSEVDESEASDDPEEFKSHSIYEANNGLRSPGGSGLRTKFDLDTEHGKRKELSISFDLTSDHKVSREPEKITKADPHVGHGKRRRRKSKSNAQPDYIYETIQKLKSQKEPKSPQEIDADVMRNKRRRSKSPTRINSNSTHCMGDEVKESEIIGSDVEQTSKSRRGMVKQSAPTSSNSEIEKPHKSKRSTDTYTDIKYSERREHKARSPTVTDPTSVYETAHISRPSKSSQTESNVERNNHLERNIEPSVFGSDSEHESFYNQEQSADVYPDTKYSKPRKNKSKSSAMTGSNSIYGVHKSKSSKKSKYSFSADSDIEHDMNHESKSSTVVNINHEHDSHDKSLQQPIPQLADENKRSSSKKSKSKSSSHQMKKMVEHHPNDAQTLNKADEFTLPQSSETSYSTTGSSDDISSYYIQSGGSPRHYMNRHGHLTRRDNRYISHPIRHKMHPVAPIRENIDPQYNGAYDNHKYNSYMPYDGIYGYDEIDYAYKPTRRTLNDNIYPRYNVTSRRNDPRNSRMNLNPTHKKRYNVVRNPIYYPDYRNDHVMNRKPSRGRMSYLANRQRNPEYLRNHHAPGDHRGRDINNSTSHYKDNYIV